MKETIPLIALIVVLTATDFLHTGIGSIMIGLALVWLAVTYRRSIRGLLDRWFSQAGVPVDARAGDARQVTITLGDGATLPRRLDGVGTYMISASEATIIPAGEVASVITRSSLQLPKGQIAILTTPPALASSGVTLAEGTANVTSEHRSSELVIRLANNSTRAHDIRPGDDVAIMVISQPVHTELRPARSEVSRG